MSDAKPPGTDAPSVALVPRAEARPVAASNARAPVELRLAESLESAGRGMFVHIDGKGQVRSPTRYRVLTALAYGASSGAILASTLLYIDIFGPLGGLVGVLLGGAFAIGLRRGRRMIKAATLIQSDRLDEAEAICRDVLAGRFVPRRLRAVAHQNLAAVATRRGQFEQALDHVRRAIQLRHSAFRSRNVLVDILAYAEVSLLVNLGRVGEARARLDGRGATPDGDFLRVQHWTADLYVQFAERRLALDDDALWERSQAALRITGAAHLLALCAWACSTRGDVDLAQHLLGEAIDRAESTTALSNPPLWRWVEENRAVLGHPRPDGDAATAADLEPDGE